MVRFNAWCQEATRCDPSILLSLSGRTQKRNLSSTRHVCRAGRAGRLCELEVLEERRGHHQTLRDAQDPDDGELADHRNIIQGHQIQRSLHPLFDGLTDAVMDHPDRNGRPAPIGECGCEDDEGCRRKRLEGRLLGGYQVTEENLI